MLFNRPYDARTGRSALLNDPAEGEANLARHDHRMSTAANLPAAKRRIAALGAELSGVDRPGKIRGR